MGQRLRRQRDSLCYTRNCDINNVLPFNLTRGHETGNELEISWFLIVISLLETEISVLESEISRINVNFVGLN